MQPREGRVYYHGGLPQYQIVGVFGEGSLRIKAIDDGTEINYKHKMMLHCGFELREAGEYTSFEDEEI